MDRLGRSADPDPAVTLTWDNGSGLTFTRNRESTKIHGHGARRVRNGGARRSTCVPYALDQSAPAAPPRSALLHPA